MTEGPRRVFWIRTRRITVVLLLVWLLVNFAVTWFAREFETGRAGGSHLGYWVVAQGALLAYLAIVIVYALVMSRLERTCLDDEPPSAAAQDAASDPA